MSSLAIKVENLSKQYRIGASEAYKTFRESIVDKVCAPFRRIKNIGKPVPEEENIWALKDVAFEVKEGEVIGIIGRNGAGKTTLLKILSRITEPTKGRVTLQGRVASLLEVGTGFHPELTGKENIYLNGAILGMNRYEIGRKFDEIIAFAEVEKFLDTPVKRYSSGMYMRLAFAVAAYLDPEILLIDEVLAVGDAAFQKKCLGKMGDVAGEGRTVLFVSHNMGAVRSLCQRVVWLKEGSIEQSGTPENVIAGYLSYGTQSGGDINWPEKNAPGCKEVRFKGVKLLDLQGNIRSSFSTEEEITCKVEYEVLKQVDGLRINLFLLTQLGEVAFATSTHSIAQKTQMPGIYMARCIIPGNILNCSGYQIKIGAGIPGKKVLWNAVDCVSFHVTGVGNQGSSYPENWPGVVCPKLEWVVEHIQV